MAIAWRTGTNAGSASSQVTSQAVTIPGTVAAGDVIYVLATQIPLSDTVPVLSASSTATAPSQVGTTQHVNQPTIPATAACALFRVVAGASDAGAVITCSSTISGFWALALGAWSGASTTAPEDVTGGGSAALGAATVTCPSETTGASGDWALYFGGGAAENGSLSIPSGATARENNVTSVDAAAVLCDSGASVGAPGTGIGGGSFSAGSNGNNLLCAFTVGLQVPGAATPAPLQAQHGPARGRPAAARGKARGSAGAPVTAAAPAVPAPLRSPQHPASGRPAARAGTARGQGGAPVTPVPAPFRSPGRPVAGRRPLPRGSARGIPGAPVTAPPLTLTVTLTQSGATRNGTVLDVKVVTGQAASPVGTAGGSASAATASIDPLGTGSWIYEAIYGFLSGGLAAESGTALRENFQDTAGNYLATGRTTGTTTASTPVTMGSTGSVYNPAISAVEIRAGTGLAEDSSGPAIVAVNATTATTASFSPPAGSLIVVMGACDTTGGTTLGITNTGGLTFAQDEANGGAGPGCTSVWTAVVPGGTPAATPAPLLPQRKPAAGRQAARKGASRGGTGAPVTLITAPSPLRPARAPAAGHPAARQGRASGSRGAPVTPVTVTPAPFQAPGKAARGAQAARPGRGLGAAGAPVTALPPVTVSPFALPVRPCRGAQGARHGKGAGAAGAPVTIPPATPAPFFPPCRPARGRGAAAPGRQRRSRGTPVTAPSAAGASSRAFLIFL